MRLRNIQGYKAIMAELNEQNLRAIVASFRAIEERMSDPLVTADNKRLTELARTRAPHQKQQNSPMNGCG